MKIEKIDFKNISPKTGDQRTSFEELCCQIAKNYKKYKVPDKSEPVRLRGEGGDGGVEFYWKLPNGTKWGGDLKGLALSRLRIP